MENLVNLLFFILQKIYNSIKRQDYRIKVMSDKTLPPSFNSNDTITPAHGLYDELNMPVNDRLVPSFLVFDDKNVIKYEIDEEYMNFSIGAGDDCDITLSDPLVSEVQVNVIMLGDECYFMDCGDRDVVEFDGVKRRQLVSMLESRVVIKVGSTFIVYVGVNANKYDETDSIILQRSLFKDAMEGSHGEILLKLNNKECYSTKKPILAGSHNACDFRIDHPDASPFHFMVYFSPRGVYLEDLTHGATGLKVNGKASKASHLITEDCLVETGKLQILLYTYEDLKLQCQTLFQNLDTQPGLVLSHLRKPGSDIVLPKVGKRMSVGRAPSCDIVLDDPSASSVHAHIMIREKYLLVQDNDSRNLTFIDLAQVSKATMRPGQIIEMGDSCFLLHFQR
jgi:pSer/pThr/pTyr-binding forkhead associated (FHA) protein